MKKLFIQFVCIFIIVATAQAQGKKSSHSFNTQYGFAYASDISLTTETNRFFKGLGYQYTTKSKWYIGTDIQYNRSSAVEHAQDPFRMQGSSVAYTCKVPGINGAMGFFFADPAMLQNISVVTNDKIYATKQEERVITQRPLTASRLNILLHVGRRWQMGRSQIEAGVSITGTFFSREVIKSDRQQQAIGCKEIGTGRLFNSMFDVTSVYIKNQQHFWAGGGLHARYQYNINKKVGVGVEVLTSASVEGLLAQVSPRLVFNF